MPASLLSNYAIIRSNDAEQVRDRLFSVYGANGFDLPSRSRSIGVRADHLQLRSTALSYCDYASDVSISFPGAAFVRQFFNIDGNGQVSGGLQAQIISPGLWSSVIPSRTPIKLDFGAGYRQLVLRIEVDALRRCLGSLLGEEPACELHFQEATARPNPEMASLRRRIFQFALDFNARGQFYAPLVAAEVENALIVNFLLYNKHSHSERLIAEPLLPAHSAVTRAEEYMVANWDKPLDILTLATITQVSARSLFRQFRRIRNYSPAEFAKRVRLQRALEMLKHPHTSTTVTQVALRCGFQNLGHFARDYYGLFGELPSETLNKRH